MLDTWYRINVSLPAVVAVGYYGGVGSLFLLRKAVRLITGWATGSIDPIQDPVSSIQYPVSVRLGQLRSSSILNSILIGTKFWKTLCTLACKHIFPAIPPTPNSARTESSIFTGVWLDTWYPFLYILLFCRILGIKSWNDFMERNCVAPKRKAKIPIPVTRLVGGEFGWGSLEAPKSSRNGVFRNFYHNPKGLWHRSFAKKCILTYILNSPLLAARDKFK